MIWLTLTTLVVVFIIGFRVLTSDSRRAIRRLSERLAITPVPVETMIDQMGKSAGAEFIQYLARPDEAHLQNAAQMLFIWQVFIVDGSEQHLQSWHRILQRPGWPRPLPMRKSVSRWAFYANSSRMLLSLMPSRCATTLCLSLRKGCTGYTDLTVRRCK
jgi:hypothetical protein